MEKNVEDKILFLTLRVFSATGGIEKVCRVMGKALSELGVAHPTKLSIYSMYDQWDDMKNDQYFPRNIFNGFGKAKIRFMLSAIKNGIICDTVILSHINLLPAGRIIKILRPKTKLILLAHGIEIWGRLSGSKKKMLQACNEIWAVSNYTRERIIKEQQVAAFKIKVLNNCLDPFLPVPLPEKKPAPLLERYGFEKTDIVMLMLSRIAATERHKNYDSVIAAMPAAMQATGKNINYLIAGKYTEEEAHHIYQVMQKYGMEQQVQLAGYIPEEELAAHFALADMFVMPSSKEGFGIVFIEAMYYGLPVIAGNRDGSVDALGNGELGISVNPDKIPAIEEAIQKVLADKKAYTPDRELLLHKFGFEQYRKKLMSILNN